jgi:TonB-like protein/PilZ domain-containing protein
MTAKGSGLEPSLRVPRARSHSRISVESITYVELCDKVGGLILNVSESGIAVQVAEKLVVQSFARLRFQLHKSDEWVETAGKLVWNNPSTKEAGIKFVNLPESAQALIKKWVLAEALQRELPKLKGRFELKRDPENPPSDAAPPLATESRVAPPPDVTHSAGDPGSARLREAMSGGSFRRDAIPNQLRDEIKRPGPQSGSPSPAAPSFGSRFQQSPAAQNLKSTSDPRNYSAARDAELRAKLGVRTRPPSRTFSKVLTGALAVFAFLLLMLFGTGTWTPAFLRRAQMSSPSGTESTPQPNGVKPPAPANVNSAADSSSRPSTSPAADLNSSNFRSSATSAAAVPGDPSRTRTTPLDSEAATSSAPRTNTYAPRQSPSSGAASSARSVQSSDTPAAESPSARNAPLDASATPPPRSSQSRVNASPRANSITHATPSTDADPVAAVEATSRFHSLRLPSDAASQSAEANQNARIGELISSNQPWYPVDAASQHVQGIVRLRAIVNRSGAVESVSVISGPQALIQPSINAARQWQFGQSFLRDQPIEVEQDITFIFTLPDDVASNK